MKKLGFVVMPLVAVSLLASCNKGGGGDDPSSNAKITLTRDSRNCKLTYNGTDCLIGNSIFIPAGITTTLKVEPANNCLPVFSSNLTFTGEAYEKTFVPETKEIVVNVAKGKELTINATTDKTQKDKLKSYSWSEINEISEGGVAPLVFKVGEDKEVDVNGKLHSVRIIGFNHDELASSPLASPEYAGITFEFANLISDSNGFSLATLWNWESGTSSTNENYLDSNLRKAIDGGGKETTHLNWYQINGTKTSGEYKTSVLDMITNNPDNEELKDALKEVRKPIALKKGSDYLVDTTSYTTKLFPLSYREMTEKPSTDVKDEGETYEFYKEEGDTDDNRIKWQVNHHDGAIDSYTEIGEDDKAWEPWSYAGYNSSTDKEGGYSWLRSPGTDMSYDAWSVSDDGYPNDLDFVCGRAFAVAPAFCI